MLGFEKLFSGNVVALGLQDQLQVNDKDIAFVLDFEFMSFGVEEFQSAANIGEPYAAVFTFGASFGQLVFVGRRISLAVFDSEIEAVVFDAQ